MDFNRIPQFFFSHKQNAATKRLLPVGAERNTLRIHKDTSKAMVGHCRWHPTMGICVSHRKRIGGKKDSWLTVFWTQFAVSREVREPLKTDRPISASFISLETRRNFALRYPGSAGSPHSRIWIVLGFEITKSRIPAMPRHRCKTPICQNNTIVVSSS